MSIQDLKWFISDTWNRLIYCPIKGHRTKMDSYGVCVQCNRHVPKHRFVGTKAAQARITLLKQRPGVEERIKALRAEMNKIDKRHRSGSR